MVVDGVVHWAEDVGGGGCGVVVGGVAVVVIAYGACCRCGRRGGVEVRAASLVVVIVKYRVWRRHEGDVEA